MTAASPGQADPLTPALQQIDQLQRQGAWAEAESRLQALAAQHPAQARIQRELAVLAARTGRLPLALQAMQRALTLAPQAAALHCEYGRLLGSAGRSDEALGAFRRASELDPQSAEAWFFLGVTELRAGAGAAAIAALRRAHALAPQSTPFLRALADAEFDYGDPSDALPCWRQLREATPDDLSCNLRLAETYSRLSRHAQAIELLVDGLRRTPQSPELFLALAQAREDTGDREGAEAAYRDALRWRPRWPLAVGALLELWRGRAESAMVELARELQASSALTDAERALVGFGLGKADDAAGRHEQAFRSWADANAARRRQIGPLDRDALRERIDTLCAVYDRALFSRLVGGGSVDARPVFVVGMPRSGTTLVEQILASHPQVHGCGELPDLALLAHGLPLRLGRLHEGGRAAAALQPDDLNSMAARYLATLDDNGARDVARAIDKAPLNFFHVGLAALLFPQARVIWCRRDPRDVGLSIFSENFSLQSNYATDLADIGLFHQGHERLMAHWQQHAPIRITEIRYEQLVAHLESESRRLVAFLDLPWDPSCLQFHTSERAVQTPSRWQVRQPIYTRSVARWRNYAAQLAPLCAALGLDPVAD